MLRAFIEAGPAGAHIASSWPGRKGNQVMQIAEFSANLKGLKEAFSILKSSYTKASGFALSAWIEHDGTVLHTWEMGHMTYEEAMRLLKIGSDEDGK
jgi:hypothetical protein